MRITLVSDARLDDIEETQQQILRQLGAVRRALNISLNEQDTIMTTVADIQAEVAEQTTVIDSAVTLLQSLSQQILDNVNDPAALEQIASDLQSNTSELADAVAANTTSEAAPTEPTAEA